MAEVSAVSPHKLVTEENVRAALQNDKGPHAKLKSWSVVDFTKPGDNYITAVTSVIVKYSIDNKNSHNKASVSKNSYNEASVCKNSVNADSEVVYIVKLNPLKTLNSMDEMAMTSFEKEAKFYLDLVPELNAVLSEAGVPSLNLPRCLYGNLDSEKQIIFFEDLRARGFKMVDRKQGLDIKHTTLILQELAKLHAGSNLLEMKLRTQNQTITELYDFLLKDWANKDDGNESIVQIITTQIKGIHSILKTVDGYEKAATWAENVIPEIPDIVEMHLRMSKYNVVCHGDCWNNNFLYRYDVKGNPVEVMLLDLQINRYASPATDLNYFLFSSLTGDVRRPNLDTFLHIYHKSFSAVLKSAGKPMIFTPSELKLEFTDKIEFGAIIGLTFGSICLSEGEDAIDFGGKNMLDDLRVKSAKMFQENSLMRSRILSIFDELMEAKIIV